MKTHIPTILFTACMLSVATMVQAQQPAAITVIGYKSKTVPVTDRITRQKVVSVPVHSGFEPGDPEYYSQNKDFNPEDLKSKEVSKEIAVSKGSDIYIETNSRTIVVKTWDQQKVKVATTVYYEGESKLTDDEWLEKINLSLKMLGTSVKVKSGLISSNGSVSFSSGVFNGVAIFDDCGQNIRTSSTPKRIVTVTVPSGSKLDVESKYADIQLPAGITDAVVDISNGNLESENVNKLVLRSKYSNANVGDIKYAELEFSNGRFSAKNIDELDVDSKYSTIEMAAAKKMVLRSTNDEYEIEEVGELSGRKNYGNLRITKLNHSLELDGTNADVKVRNVGSALNLIKMDNRYADIRIPLRAVKNYSIEFAGPYSSVYGNFEKVPVTTDKEKSAESKSLSTNDAPAAVSGTEKINREIVVKTIKGFEKIYGELALVASNLRDDKISIAHFTAKTGTGTGLKIEMTCRNCTVDFK